MKTLKNLIAMIAMIAFISTNVFAQQPAATKAAPAKAEQKPAQGGVKELSAKDQWLKDYNEMKPKMDRYLAKAKSEGDKNPEFTTEVKKLDMAMTDFKSKIDKWDNATPEQRAKYEDMMKQEYARIQQQEAKVKEMYGKMNVGGTEQKAAPAKQ
jgi:uncharacterized coiled-coil DUF342 family protein